ncbi:hypothetical protein [Nocardia sp.]|uniref:hypothetical protein n=1 Tax=Nocardia sp. TaxID=1821 RepID=UPI00261141A7|nr:hypothetical protein [Nocardia sp.]
MGRIPRNETDTTTGEHRGPTAHDAREFPVEVDHIADAQAQALATDGVRTADGPSADTQRDQSFSTRLR